MVGCLVTVLVVTVLAVVVVAAGAYVVRQMFPSTDSIQEATACTVMRVVVDNAETFIEQADATAVEKAEMRRSVQELRAEYERGCGPIR